MRLREAWHRHPALLAMVPLLLGGLTLNVVPARLVVAHGWPLYLDCIGTVAVAMLGGNLPAVLVGFGANAINGVSEPDTLYYGMISILIASTAAYFHHHRYFQTLRRMLVVVATLALLGGGLGSLVTYFLYDMSFAQGVSGPYAQAIRDYCGWGEFPSQLLADLLVDLVDKTLTVAAAVLAYRLVPKPFRKGMDRAFHRDSRALAANRMVRHSLLRKVTITVIAAEMALGGLAVSIGVMLYRDKAHEHFTDIAKSVTNHAALFIDPERVDEFIREGEAAPGYLDTKKRLTDIKACFAQTKYLYVYQIQKDGCHVVFDLDSDGVPGGKPGEVVPFDPSFMPYLPDLLAGKAIDPITSDDQYGWLLTVYAPLRNAAGRTVAYVAADIAMDKVWADVAKFFIMLLSLFFGLSLIIMSVVVEFVKRDIVVPANRMSTAAMKFAVTTTLASGLDSEQVDLGRIRHAAERVEGLKIQSSDEIGNLYDSFATMVLNTYDFIEQVQRQAERINRMQEVIITEFAEMVEARDKSTGDHVKKTAAYVEALARELQAEGKYPDVVTDDYIRKLKRAAPLHDVGKIAVSDLILNKQGKLTDEEFAIMKSHTTEGWKFFTKMLNDAGDTIDANYLAESIDMAHYHHEKWDGTGYPAGIKGDQIPLSARIMAVADVFDALIAERVYKKPFSYEKAMAIITEGAGKHFDPVVVEAFSHISEKLYRERTVLAKPAPGADPAPPPAGGPA